MIAVTNEKALKVLKKKSIFMSKGYSGITSKATTIFGVEFVYLYLVGIFTAHLGWLTENIVKLISSGIIDCRFHLLPFISPYALVPIALHIFLKDPDDVSFFGKRIFNAKTKNTVLFSNLISLTVICLVVFVGEFIVGNAWEILFGVRLWNYSAQPLHLTQYVSFFSAVGYGTGAYLLFRYAVKPSVSFIKKHIGFETAQKICLTIGLWIVIDTLIMFFSIAASGRAPIYWSIKF